MIVYACIPDLQPYKQLLDLENIKMPKTRFDELDFQGTSKAENWNPPSLKWIIDDESESEQIPDIAHWRVSTLVLSPKANKVLKPLFGNEAEFLPVPVENEEGWTILNVTNMQDIFDEANSRYRIRPSGEVGRLLKMAINKTKLTNGKLFKIVDHDTYICSSDIPGSFKDAVEKNKLTGLKFKKI